MTDIPLWAWWALFNAAVVIGYVVLSIDELRGDGGRVMRAWVVLFCTAATFLLGAIFIALAHWGDRRNDKEARRG